MDEKDIEDIDQNILIDKRGEWDWNSVQMTISFLEGLSYGQPDNQDIRKYISWLNSIAIKIGMEKKDEH